MSELLTAAAVDSSGPAPPSPALLDVSQVANLLNCSARHVYRLSDGGRMPRPLKLGALVRWPRQAIEQWIAGGCKPCREGARQ